jgi:hypothetical protein
MFLDVLSKTSKPSFSIAGLRSSVCNQGPPEYETGVRKASSFHSGVLCPRFETADLAVVINQYFELVIEQGTQIMVGVLWPTS